REMQRDAIVAGDAETHALGREGEAFDRAGVLEFLRAAVGETHEGGAAGSIGNRALWARSDAADPFAPGLGEHFGRFARAGADLAVLAAGDQTGFRLVERRGEQPVVDLKGLMAMVEPMDGAVGQREMRHAAEEDGGDTMAIEI